MTEHGNSTREQYQTQAPIGATPAGLAASIALGRLLRMAPHADIASIRFQIVAQGEGAYAGPGPYVVCSAAEPDECPSCHTHAGHPHTEYCQRVPPSLILDMPPDVSEDELREFAERFSAIQSGGTVRPNRTYLVGEQGCDFAVPGQTSQPATRTSQPHTEARIIKAADHPNDWSGTLITSPRTCRICGCTDDNACDLGCYWVGEDLCSSCHGGGFSNTTPLATPTPCPDCGVDLAATGDGCTNPNHRA